MKLEKTKLNRKDKEKDMKLNQSQCDAIVKEIYGECMPEHYTIVSVTKAVDMLSDEQQRVLGMRFVAGCKFKDIANELGVSPSYGRTEFYKVIRLMRHPKFKYTIEGIEYDGVTEFSPVSELDISSRVYHALYRSGLCTVGQVLNCGYHGLLNIRNIGVSGIAEIKNELDKYGITLEIPNEVPTNLIKTEDCKLIRLAVPKSRLKGGTVSVTFNYEPDSGECTVISVE